jgi:hypothetical protein
MTKVEQMKHEKRLIELGFNFKKSFQKIKGIKITKGYFAENKEGVTSKVYPTFDRLIEVLLEQEARHVD